MGDMAGAGSMATGGAMASDMDVAGVRPWATLDFLLMFLMWSVMMVGMMVPSAAPMTLLYAAVARKAARQGATPRTDGSFRRWLPRHVVSLQRPRHRGAVGARPSRTVVADDGGDQPRARRPLVDRCRHLPADAREKRLLGALPCARPFLRAALASGHARRLPHGASGMAASVSDAVGR